jgi:N-acetylneuraminic acid mutarotase
MIYYNYISFYLFFFIYFFLEIESFVPARRYAHSSILVRNKLYFLGGGSGTASLGGICSNEVFYLDVTQSFNVEVPPWNVLTSNSGIPFRSCWGTVSLVDNQTIYLIGGLMHNIFTDNDAYVSFVYSFSLASLTWTVPTIKGNPPSLRRSMNSVIDNTRRIYIFGGNNYFIASIKEQAEFNDMIILNTADLSWTLLSSTIDISKRAEYTATLLSSGMIVYIGGFNNDGTIKITQINLYDTKSSIWSVMVCII